MIEPLSTRLAVRAESADLTAGADWYPMAQRTARQLAREHSVTPSAAAAAIAAHSPRTQWADNVRRASMHLAGHPYGMTAAIKRADRALAAPRGQRAAALFNDGGAPKVRAFYRNIMGDPNAVTVDIWAMRAAGIDRHPSNAAEYADVERAYQRAAETVGIAPRDLQAALWIDIRGKAD